METGYNIQFIGLKMINTSLMIQQVSGNVSISNPIMQGASIYLSYPSVILSVYVHGGHFENKNAIIGIQQPLRNFFFIDNELYNMRMGVDVIAHHFEGKNNTV